MSALISGGVHSRRGFGSGPLRRVLALKGQAISQMLHVYLVLAASPAARSKRPKIARPSPGGSGLLRPSASSTPRPARQPESAEGDNRRAFACVGGQERFFPGRPTTAVDLASPSRRSYVEVHVCLLGPGRMDYGSHATGLDRNEAGALPGSARLLRISLVGSNQVVADAGMAVRAAPELAARSRSSAADSPSTRSAKDQESRPQ